MHTRHTVRCLAAGLLLATTMVGAAGANTMIDTKGDVTFERVHVGYGGSPRESLGHVLAGYVDPLTGLPSPITNRDGTPITVGNVDLGEDPALSNQTQIQRFFTDTDQTYELTYLGLGYASYHNIMGFYTYEPGEANPRHFDYTPLVTQGVDAPGTMVTFDVEADHYFGLYLSADGARRERNRFFSENIYNTDGRHHAETDHLLAFDTNRGLLVTWEDLPMGRDGKLGDQDYEDMIGGLLTYPGGDPIPEPATFTLIGAWLGITLLARRPRRKQA